MRRLSKLKQHLQASAVSSDPERDKGAAWRRREGEKKRVRMDRHSEIDSMLTRGVIPDTDLWNTLMTTLSSRTQRLALFDRMEATGIPRDAKTYSLTAEIASPQIMKVLVLLADREGVRMSSDFASAYIASLAPVEASLREATEVLYKVSRPSERIHTQLHMLQENVAKSRSQRVREKRPDTTQRR
ncbi:hypothetical protein DIPPA_32727 [Diplonema papillatum]|nr:hypothetical protein DIPPA_32727 [Diplonema papillatum]